MAYRIAKALDTLRSQVNAAWPKRNKASDGWIGDPSHASRASDHNPHVKDGKTGVVTALDITHDPAHGVDAGQVAETVKTDPRVKYVIWNRRIYNPSVLKAWRAYHGTNPHTKHVHLSVRSEKAHYDSIKPWNLEGVIKAPGGPVVTPEPAVTAPAKPLLKKGSKGQHVRNLQARLGITVDGDFGPKTEAAVKAFQTQSGLVADGKVGPYTWEALDAPATPGPPVPVSGDVPDLSTPVETIKTFESLGWSRLEAVALTASLVWESGGNSRNPQQHKIIWDAKGDLDESGVYRSLYAPQWNGPRITAYEAFATKRQKPFTDPETQLLYVDHELKTTERKAAAALRAATTIEEANTAAISFWRPSDPHADHRLAIAKALL